MAAPAPHEPATYAELYQGMPDVLAGEYQAFLNAFSPESDQAPATLRDSVLAAGSEVPKVFLCLTNNPPRVMVLHRPTRYAPTLGLACRWDEHVYAFATDVGAGNMVSVRNWPADAFARSVIVHVPTMGEMDNQWATDQAADCLGPYAAGLANTEPLRARFLCPVPQAYSHRVLVRRVFTPREFWTDVIHQVIADGRQAACQTLIDWARVASVLRPDVGNGPQPPAIAQPEPDAPAADETLLRRVWSWVLSDLPALAGRTGTAAAATAHAMAGLQVEFAQQRADAAAARAAASAPKTPSAKYPQTVGGIRRICEAPTDADLPQLWHVLANASKKEGIQAVQALVDTRADTVGLVPPVITPELYTRINEARFGTATVDDLTAGLSPFLITVGASDEAMSARGRAATFAVLQGAEAAPDLAEIRELTTAAPYMVQTLTKSLYVYKGYSVLLDIVLGIPHRVSTHFRDSFVPAYERKLMDIEGQFSPSELPAYIPLFLRHTQLEMMSYFNDAALEGANAALPDVEDLIRIITRRRWTILPTLPAGLFAPRASPAPAPTPSPPRGSGGSGGAPTGTPSTPVTNTTPVTALIQRWGNHTGTLRSVTGSSATKPRTDDGSAELCLSYHLRGACNTDCRRRASHRVATPTELQRIQEYLTAAGVAAL